MIQKYYPKICHKQYKADQTHMPFQLFFAAFENICKNAALIAQNKPK